MTDDRRHGAGRPKPQTQRFVSSSTQMRLDADQRRRQAAVMSAAKSVLRSRDEVLDFFNSWSDELGGRPLDLATDSDAGLAQVRRALQSLGQSDARETTISPYLKPSD